MKYLYKIHSVVLLLWIGFLFPSCNNPVTHANEKHVLIDSNSVQYLKAVMIDSLNMLSDSLTICRLDSHSRYVLYIDKLNETKIGIVAITDSVLYMYTQQGKVWHQIDSAKFDDYARDYYITDLNGDKKEDLVIKGVGDMHGQSMPYVFINNANNELHYRLDIKLRNIEYDSIKKMVKSSYYGGTYSLQNKEYYRWQNDSLQLVEGVEIMPERKTAYTTFYKNKNGKRYNYKTIKDKDWIFFENALWKD